MNGGESELSRYAVVFALVSFAVVFAITGATLLLLRAFWRRRDERWPR